MVEIENDQMGNHKSDTDWKDGFLFVGNQLALDFVNTRPVHNSEPMELLPDFPALLRWFQAAGLLDAREAANLRRSGAHRSGPGTSWKPCARCGRSCGKRSSPRKVEVRFIAPLWMN